MKRTFYTITTLIIAGVLSFQSPHLLAQTSSPLQITEFMASNNGALLDEDEAASDWIEIHNTSNNVVDLAGWSLSDDDAALSQWTFPEHTLEPNAYLIVFASGKSRSSDPAGFFHTNFKLSMQSAFLALVEPDGSTLATAFEPYPSQLKGYSAGRADDGSTRYFATPTPGTANSQGIEGIVSEVRCDVTHGFYEESFALTLSCDTGDAQILFTTDGSEPSVFGGTKYMEPIVIDSTTVVRAHATKRHYQSSKLVTQTYVFLEDVITQAADGVTPQGWPEEQVNGQVFYYQMHSAMLDRLGEAAVIESMRSLPSLSLVTPLSGLLSKDSGIYVNPGKRGRDWERPASLELLTSSGEAGFEVSCGVRIRGGISRGGDFPKHSFRLLFRKEYGDAKLRYPLFEDEGVHEFDNIDLRSATNWSWSQLGGFPQGASQNTLLRDISSRDTQGALGMPYTRSRYYHLFLNGLYWGVYMTQERAEASFAASYLGENKEEYDVVKVNRGSGAHTEATDGDLNAWRQLHQLSRSHKQDPDLETYMAMQGLNQDGSRNPDLPVLLNVDQLIDYMLIVFWTANNDAPISAWGSNDWSNNWYGIRNRVRNDQGFHFFIHDAENSYGITGYSETGGIVSSANRTGPYTGNAYSSGTFSQSNPQFLHQDLMNNPEYQLRFADRVQKHCFHEGSLTDKAVAERFTRRRNEVAAAIPAHAARWGHRFATKYDERTWENEVDSILSGFIPGRTEILLGQLRGDDLLATIPTPEFNQHGGSEEKGFPVHFENALTSNQKLYYTLDGSDPRLSGGALASTAQLYDHLKQDGIILTSSTTVRARVQATALFNPIGEWSALTEARFQVGSVPAKASNIAFSEIHYHPAEPSEAEREAGFTEDKVFEFLELHNPTDHAVSLEGVRIVDGIEIAFASDAEIAPNGHVVIANNLAAFAFRYGETVPVIGEFAGSLSNSGERIAFVDATQQLILEIEYDDALPWPEQADGDGYSLTRNEEGQANSPLQWHISTVLGGSPGSGANMSTKPSILDSDSDGATDKEELLAGTDPNNPESFLRILSIQREASGVELTWSSVIGKTYKIEYSKRLSDILWAPIAEHVADSAATTAIHSSLNGNVLTQGYYRVVALE